jgi:tetratricopeptide (TPR) repeat protein
VKLFVCLQIHFQNRVCSAARDPATWVQYALFCLRQTASEYRAQAEACLKEALRLQPDHVVALNVYAALLLEQNNLDQADVFVRGALSSDTTGASSETAASSVEVGKHAGVLTHVLSALWEYANEEDELSDAAFALAARAFPAALSTINTQPLIGDESVFVYAARVLLSLRCTQSAQRLLEKDVRDGKVSTLSRVIEQFKLGWQKSEDCESVLIPFVQDTDTAPKHPALLSTLGHFYFEHERYAVVCFQFIVCSIDSFFVCVF